MLSRSILVCHSILILSNVLCSLVSGETGCPPPEEILPCTCRSTPNTTLECRNVNTVEELSTVSKNAERYIFQEVHIVSSIVTFLPREMLESSRVNELYLVNSTFVQLFDSAPQGSLLYKLHIENSHVARIKDLSILKSLTNLRILSISGNTIHKIDSKFTENLPSSLKEISFIGTETREIENGAFTRFPSLDKFVVRSSKLCNISRQVFPSTFNARFIYLDNNNISRIPDDLFRSMPQLQFVSLMNNHLSEFPKAAFLGRDRNVPYVRLDGNPLKCNCLLVWLITDKPEILGGTCAAPKHLRGRDLRDLRPGDFNC